MQNLGLMAGVGGRDEELTGRRIGKVMDVMAL